MRMEAKSFLFFVQTAIEKEEDEKLHHQWSSMLPFMSLKMLEYIPFKEYKDKVLGRNIDLRPTSEIIKEIEEAHGKKVNV